MIMLGLLKQCVNKIRVVLGFTDVTTQTIIADSLQSTSSIWIV